MSSDHDEIIALGIKLDAVEVDIKELTKTVKEQSAALNKYKGVIGGVMLIFGLFTASATLFFNYLKVKL